MPVTPYLFFDGRCEEALEFYKKAIGAEVGMMMRYSENPEPPQAPDCMPSDQNKIMHSAFQIGNTTIMASDGMAAGNPKFEGFALSINARDEADAARKFNALAEGGHVRMPLAKTFFAKSFGMVADRFGVGWMIIVEP